MNLKWYSCDFETRNSEKNISEECTSVWLWDIYDIKSNKHITGTDIDGFILEVFRLKSSIFYFHNLKFDGNFLLSRLLELGFFICDDRIDKGINCIITDRLVWYSMTVHFGGKKYEFRDSSKKIIGSLESAAKDFQLDILKGSIDYGKDRPIDYSPTKEEINYIHNDTEIVAKILKYYYDEGMTSLTNAMDAMKAFKKIVSENGFKMYFPTLDLETDNFIRKSYKGGFCYLNKKYKGIDLNDIYAFDVKSMYPSVMVDAMLPYGVPKKYYGSYKKDKDYPLFIQHIRFNGRIKDGFIPTIQTKSFMSIKLNYLTDTNGQIYELYLTSVDLFMLLKTYEIYEIEYIDGYKFKGITGLFKPYIDYYFDKKEKSVGAVKMLYKIYLNSLYGKFAMMTERRAVIPEITDEGLKFIKGDYETVEPVYTAVASFITSWARFKLLNGIYANLDIFIYCDTDSIYLSKQPQSLDVGKTLGKFAIEHGDTYFYDGSIVKRKEYSISEVYFSTEIKKARFLGQKCYILECESKDSTYLYKKIAGAPNKVKDAITFNNFEIGFSSDPKTNPKLRMKNVKGGVLLIPTSFSIKEKQTA